MGSTRPRRAWGRRRRPACRSRASGTTGPDPPPGASVLQSALKLPLNPGRLAIARPRGEVVHPAPATRNAARPWPGKDSSPSRCCITKAIGPFSGNRARPAGRQLGSLSCAATTQERRGPRVAAKFVRTASSRPVLASERMRLLAAILAGCFSADLSLQKFVYIPDFWLAFLKPARGLLCRWAGRLRGGKRGARGRWSRRLGGRYLAARLK